MTDLSAAIQAIRHDGLLPPCRFGMAHLYVLQFNTGIVKIGCTSDVARRLSELARNAAPFGAEITDFWISKAAYRFLDSEAVLMSRCRDRSVQIKREYFSGVEFGWVTELAGTLISPHPALTRIWRGAR